jgi:hypothetical protein
MPSYHLQIFLGGIPNEREVDTISTYSNDRIAEKCFCNLWNKYGSHRKMATLTRIMADGDLKLIHQIGPFQP